MSGLPSKNVLVLLMYILMRRAAATEWDAQKTRGLDEIEPRDTHLHHIYPFNFMVENKDGLARFTKDDRSQAEYRKEINDIVNLTFLGKEKNSSIGDEPPWVYLPTETTRENRKAHFIPEDKSLWTADKFPDFLRKRRELLSAAMTKLVKS